MIIGGINLNKKGDKVVYPNHGAGTISAIEEKDVFSTKSKYYILELSVGQLTISVPVDKSHELGLRNVITKRDAGKVLKVISKKVKAKKDVDSNERFKELSEKLRTGDAFEIAGVIRDLRKLEKMSTREKRMFSKAKDLLISELIFSFNKTEEEMVKQVNKVLN
ncbi:MAG TPA: CarD family transcriptional regulator [Actinobacteria bacterium]|nr:CarD family transcriptional regulator [Actinomycetota bacterium]